MQNQIEMKISNNYDGFDGLYNEQDKITEELKKQIQEFNMKISKSKFSDQQIAELKVQFELFD